MNVYQWTMQQQQQQQKIVLENNITFIYFTFGILNLFIQKTT